MSRVIAAAESWHWYNEGGTPVWDVPSADGKSKINPTLREARKFGLLPGVTGVNKQLANPFLESWKQENAIKFAFANPVKPGESLEDYIRRVSWLADSVGRDAAEAGKLIHKDVEEFFLEGTYPVAAASKRAVDTIAGWLKAEGYTKFTPEASFGVRAKGYGGRVDLLAQRDDESAAVLDFKTCDIVKIRTPYDSWGYQLAAYKSGLGLHPASRVISVPIDRGTGETKFMEWGEAEQESNLRIFQYTFELWCLRKNYDPRKWEEAK